MARVLVYVPQPDLRGHIYVIETSRELEPGVYNDVFRVPGRELKYIRGSLWELITQETSWGQQLYRELAPYLGDLKYVVVQFTEAYFLKPLTLIAPVKDLRDVKVEGGYLRGQKICVDLPDKEVCVSYRESTDRVEPTLWIKDKFEAVKKLLGIGEEIVLSEEAREVIEKVSAHVNQTVLEVTKTVPTVDVERLKRILLIRGILDEIANTGLDYLTLSQKFSEVKKTIRSEAAKKKLDEILEEVKRTYEKVSSLAAFLRKMFESELETLLSEARKRATTVAEKSEEVKKESNRRRG